MDRQDFEALIGVEPPPWEPPVPFAAVRLPEWPTWALPGTIEALVEALAESTQTPPEMAGLLSLGVLAAVYQSRYKVQVTPDWEEPLCLYCAAIAPPGERKSAVISALTRPIYAYEAERQAQEAGEIERARTERDLLARELETAKRKGRRIEALALAERLAGMDVPAPYRILADDVTVERLVDLMDQHDGCMAIVSAEGGLFDTITGRYSAKSNLDIYLKGHAGDPVTVDRISRGTNQVSSPRLSMILTVQPDVLQGLMANTTLRGRGLCGRILYAMCQSKVGRRLVDPPPVPPEVTEAYTQAIREGLAGRESGILRLSPEADELRRQYQQHVEEQLGGAWEHMRDWGGKLVGACIRIAGLLHAATALRPAEEPIGPETMAAAVRLAQCLGAHAEAAYQIMGADQADADARYLWGRIRAMGQLTVSKRDLWRGLRSYFRDQDKMSAALAILEDMGYVRLEETNTGGRPTVGVAVNPLAL